METTNSSAIKNLTDSEIDQVAGGVGKAIVDDCGVEDCGVEDCGVEDCGIEDCGVE